MKLSKKFLILTVAICVLMASASVVSAVINDVDDNGTTYAYCYSWGGSASTKDISSTQFSEVYVDYGHALNDDDREEINAYGPQMVFNSPESTYLIDGKEEPDPAQNGRASAYHTGGCVTALATWSK